MMESGFKARYWSFLYSTPCFLEDFAEYQVQLFILLTARGTMSPVWADPVPQMVPRGRARCWNCICILKKKQQYWDVVSKAQSAVGDTEVSLGPARFLSCPAGLPFCFSWLSTCPSEQTIFVPSRVVLPLFVICFHSSSVTVVFALDFWVLEVSNSDKMDARYVFAK